MKTKYYVTFLNRINNFESDIELVDIMNISITKNRLNVSNDDKLFFDLEESQHPTLARKKNCNKNRILSIRHLKATVYISFIKEIYEEVTLYLRSILRIAAVKGFEPGRLIGENNDIKMSANDILRLGSRNQVARKVADQIYQRLESERSNIGLIRKINDKLGLKLNTTVIDEAIPFLEIRHLLVHENGIVPDEFKTRYPDIPIDKHNSIELDYHTVRMAKEKISRMIQMIDRRVVSAGFIPSEELQR